METFSPVVSFDQQKFLFLLTFVLGFSSVVLFFLYENKKSRKFVVEIVSAIVAAFSLGAGIFFALLRADIVL